MCTIDLGIAWVAIQSLQTGEHEGCVAFKQTPASTGEQGVSRERDWGIQPRVGAHIADMVECVPRGRMNLKVQSKDLNTVTIRNR